jgi:hypothetical protein
MWIITWKYKNRSTIYYFSGKRNYYVKRNNWSSFSDIADWEWSRTESEALHLDKTEIEWIIVEYNWKAYLGLVVNIVKVDRGIQSCG